jgi:hypothetical protein
MSIVLIGDLSPAAYENWRAQLSQHLPPDETLALATQLTDKSAVDVALAANPRWGELAHFPNLRFVQSLWPVWTACWAIRRYRKTSPLRGSSTPQWRSPWPRAP